MTTPKKVFFLLIALFMLSILPSCGSDAGEIRPGSICTVENGDGTFGVVKVLVIDENEAHVKIYANDYDTRPEIIDVSTLTMGSITDDAGFGIGHVPLERKGFDDWKPKQAAFEAVAPEELEGYELWKNQ